MKKTEFDAIIVGCGPNGMTLANYLRKAGLEVAIIERKLEIGGGLTTEEPIIPGVWHNFQHTFHGPIYESKPIQQLEIHEFNSQWIVPAIQAANLLPGGGSVAIYDDLERTLESVARHSQKDASTWRSIANTYTDITRTLLIDAQTVLPSELEAFRARALQQPGGTEVARWSAISPLEVVDELFESPAVKALVLNQMAMPRGIVPDYKGHGLAVLGVVTGVDALSFCLGGSHVYAQSVWRAMMTNGCTILTMLNVEKILVENGRATGVVLNDGNVLKARKFVVSAIDLEQTFLKLVGRENLDGGFVSRLEQRPLDEFSIWGMHVAMRELPNYGSAELNNAWHVNVGLDTPDAIMAMFADIRAGRLPRNPQLYVSCPTLLDHSTAPVGVNSGLVWQLAPYALNGSPENWTQPFKKELEGRVLGTLATVAPNLSEGNIIGSISFSPWDLARKFTSMPKGAVYQGAVIPNPPANASVLPELLDYRTPIRDLYVAGGATHPAGGILGLHGFNAANVLAADYGIQKWWN